MKIIKIKDIQDDGIFQVIDTINGVTFLEQWMCDQIIEFSHKKIHTIENWFNIIGIKYDKINVTSKVNYEIGGKILELSDLSSGERYLLYLLACKEVNKPLIAQGVFERMGSRLQTVASRELAGYENLIIITYNIYPASLKDYIVKEIT